MFKKITGLLILISFLLIKSMPLFAADQYVEKVVTCSIEHNTEDNQDAEKETKQLEIGDEDFIDGAKVKEIVSFFSTKIWPTAVPCVFSTYIALPYPPPNGDL
jgi:hypothetical protein